MAKLLGKGADTKKKSVTIIHSATTETVRLPDDNNGVRSLFLFSTLNYKYTKNQSLHSGHRSHGHSHQGAAQKEGARRTVGQNENDRHRSSVLVCTGQGVQTARRSRHTVCQQQKENSRIRGRRRRRPNGGDGHGDCGRGCRNGGS